MNEFLVRDGQFWLNGEPQLIQAGEFHYFRTPKDQWRHRLNLLREAGFNALASYIPWLWHQLEEDVSDFTGYSHPMRDLAGFLDLAAEMGFWIIARPGPYIMAETINEGIPQWVFSKYPQAAFIDQHQAVQNFASYLHPDFLACVRKWYRSIFEVLTPRLVTRGGKIVMVQLDNEMGMLQWVRNVMDINPDTLTRFAAYLENGYGAHHPNPYPAGQWVDLLREGILNPNGQYSRQIVEDYRRFYRGYLLEYASFLLSEAKSNGLDVLPVINIHGFANGGKTFPIGLSQLVDVMNMDGMVSGTDAYPGFIGEGNFHQLLLVNEMTKALQNKQQPLTSMEFQAGGNQDFGGGQSSLYDLHTRLCISSGMRAINHYLFFDGENHPLLSPTKRHDWGHPVRKDGTLRGDFHRYPKLSKVLQSYGKDLILARPKTVTTIGFLLDYFMTEVNNTSTQEAANILTHQRDTILFDMIARGLSLTHRPFNAVDLDRDDLDVQRMPVCWVMMEKQCPAIVQQKLVEYVNQGGKLILAGRMCAEGFYHEECKTLQKAIGIESLHSDPPFVWTSISAFHYQDIPVSFVETYSGEFDEIFATNEHGDVVGFVKNLGKGKLMMFGASMAANTLDDLDVANRMALKMDCLPLFKLDSWADVRLSEGENGSFLYINNYQDDPIETTIEYSNQMLLGGNPVCLPARRGMILPIDWRIRDGIMLHYASSEINEIRDDGTILVLKTDQNQFSAEMSLRGYHGEDVKVIAAQGETQRAVLQGTNGTIVIKKGL